MSEPVVTFKINDDWNVVMRFADLETVKPEDFFCQVPAYRVVYNENDVCEFEVDKWLFTHVVRHSRILNPDITVEEVAKKFFETFWDMTDEDEYEVMEELEKKEEKVTK